MKARWLYVVTALIAAALFATSLWIGPWWTVGDVAIGPFGSRYCFGGDCRPGGLGWIGGSVMWERAATATWAGAFLSMVGLIGLAGGIAAGRMPTLVAKSTLVAIATAVFASAYWVTGFPGNSGAPSLGVLRTQAEQGFSMRYGVALYGAAVCLGLVAPLWLLVTSRRR